MALPAPTPPQKRVFTIHSKCRFQLMQCTYVRNLHVWQTKRKTVTGEINNCIKKTQANAGTKNKVYFQQKARVNANMRLVVITIWQAAIHSYVELAYVQPYPHPARSLVLISPCRGGQDYTQANGELTDSVFWLPGVFRRDSRFANYRFLFCKSLAYFH